MRQDTVVVGIVVKAGEPPGPIIAANGAAKAHSAGQLAMGRGPSMLHLGLVRAVGSERPAGDSASLQSIQLDIAHCTHDHPALACHCRTATTYLKASRVRRHSQANPHRKTHSNAGSARSAHS